jgi:hypothetical protein
MSANWLHHRPDQPGQQAMPVPGRHSRESRESSGSRQGMRAECFFSVPTPRAERASSSPWSTCPTGGLGVPH